MDNKEECRSLETMDKEEWKSEEYNLVKTGEQVWPDNPDRKFVFYKDTQGRSWYRTFIRTEYGWVTQEQLVYNKALSKKKRPA